MGDKKTIAVKVDEELHMLLKRECATERITIAQYVIDAIVDKLKAEKAEDERWTIKEK